MTTGVETQALARGVLEELSDERLVLRLPGTEYRLQLVPARKAGEFTTPVGKRIKGVIQATALRLHTARAGGRFIEPVWGAPRIVQGVVLATEQSRLLVDVSVPMWVRLQEGQTGGDFQPGQLVNFYVQSGTTFTPVED